MQKLGLGAPAPFAIIDDQIVTDIVKFSIIQLRKLSRSPAHVYFHLENNTTSPTQISIYMEKPFLRYPCLSYKAQS